MVEDISKDWCRKVIMQIENEKKVNVDNIRISSDQVFVGPSYSCAFYGTTYVALKKKKNFHRQKSMHDPSILNSIQSA